MTNTTRPSVTPWIIGPDTRSLMDFIVAAFEARDVAIVDNPDGSVGHAEATIGDSLVMGFDSKPDWPATPAFLRLWVDDCEATVASAVSAGAHVVTEPTDLFWGDRVGRVRDPWDNVWWIQQHLEDVPPDEMETRAQDPAALQAMTYVQNAEIVRR
jgi:PhnB protein